MSTVSIVYASYDRVPAPKGAATHIDAFARCLAREFSELSLITVAGADDLADDPMGQEFAKMGRGTWARSERQYGDGIKHFPLPACGSDLIQRALFFRRGMQAWWGDRHVDVCHFRSIFEGYPIACRKQEFCKKIVYEVNGLPSIELKYHYPEVADDRELLSKLRAQEQRCLEAADLVITVSQVTAEHLHRRGVAENRIVVIPNGVNTELFPFVRPRPWRDRELQLLYAGTLAPWQGVLLAIEALALLRRDFPARLTIVGSARARQRKVVERRCAELDLTPHVTIAEPVSQAQLAELHHACDVVLAPLGANDRNLVQGCCPLKILEAMACGTPLVSSDLPVVRSLVRAGIDAVLVRPGSAKAIKDALLRMRNDPHLGPQLSASARRRVKQHFSWQRAQQQLINAYYQHLLPLN